MNAETRIDAGDTQFSDLLRRLSPVDKRLLAREAIENDDSIVIVDREYVDKGDEMNARCSDLEKQLHDAEETAAIAQRDLTNAIERAEKAEKALDDQRPRNPNA